MIAVLPSQYNGMHFLVYKWENPKIPYICWVILQSMPYLEPPHFHREQESVLYDNVSGLNEQFVDFFPSKGDEGAICYFPYFNFERAAS